MHGIDLSIFATLIADPRLPFGMGAAMLSGLVRGFAGFGSALIYIPLMSTIYDPKIAVMSFLPTDLLTGTVYAVRLRQLVSWREVLPMAVAAAITIQFGALLLEYADPTTLRWTITGMVAFALPLLISGWRYQVRPSMALNIGVGLFSGLIGGAVQIAGPPILLYWLGSMHPSSVVRASIMAFFTIFTIVSIITYVAHGLMTFESIAICVFLVPMYIIAMWIGAYLYKRASEQTYRRIAYVIIAVSAIIGAPVLDRYLRPQPPPQKTGESVQPPVPDNRMLSSLNRD
ncbi:MAG: sulfite exporter TauE/SafE family protein [Pseudorhodoplanes sp.]